jgi:uncharacterized protein YfdQ (DUF2303 family)
LPLSLLLLLQFFQLIYSRTETGKPTMSEKRRSFEAVDEDVAWDWRDHFFEELVNADISSLGK